MPLTPLPHGISFTEVGYSAPGGGVGPQPIVLGPLTLSAATAPADAEAGTIIGVIQGKTAGSSLSITPNDGRVALAGDDAGGWSLVVGLTAVSEGELLVTIRETHPQAEGPSDNPVAITVTPPTGGGVAPVPEPAEIMISSRLCVCGNGGGIILQGSNGTDRDGNTTFQFWNEQPITVTKFIATFQNWRVTNNGEVPATNDITVWASIEYPIGSGKQVFASGLVIAANETERTVEFTLATPLPPYEAARGIVYVEVPEGGVWPQNLIVSPALGEAADFNTGVNKTVSGIITDASSGTNGTRKAGYGPTAIIATDWIGKAISLAVVGIGDSIMAGVVPMLSAHGNMGSFGRGLDGVAPFLNSGFFGANPAENISMPLRLDLYLKCAVTDAIIRYGSNPLTSGGKTGAAIWSEIVSIRDSLEAAGIRVWVSTVDPRVSSTDDYLKTENMTPNGASYIGGIDSERHKLNVLIRANTPPDRLIDTASFTETFPGSGVFHSATTLGGNGYFRAPLPFTVDGPSTTTSVETNTTSQSPTNLFSTGNGRIYLTNGPGSDAKGRRISTGPNVEGVLVIDTSPDGALPGAPEVGNTGVMIDDNPITRDGIHHSAGVDGSNYSGQKFVAESAVRPPFAARKTMLKAA